MDLLNYWKYLLFLVLSVQLSNGYPRYQDVNHNSNALAGSHDFDVLIFAQSWPKTVCSEWKEISVSNKCNLPKNSAWSIHGLWPTQLHKMGPFSCNKNLHFDPKVLQSIKQELLVKWIDVHGKHPETFWEHEWTKHGTCAAALPSLKTEKKYFEKGLELFEKYAMKNVLNQAKIVPGRKYPVQKILDGVKNVLGVNSIVTCQQNPQTHDQSIHEIRICFSKNLSLVNCDGAVSFPTNCKRSMDVTY